LRAVQVRRTEAIPGTPQDLFVWNEQSLIGPFEAGADGIYERQTLDRFIE
jgi:hypothetical protein